MKNMVKTVTLESRERTGLLPRHAGVGPVAYKACATIPVLEALIAAGAAIEMLPASEMGYLITLGDKMPEGIVACHLNDPPHMGLRLAIEPEFPGEYDDYWRQVDFTPCPVCGAPVVWYEAGYVPGYRVCAKPPHHHSIAKRASIA
jgi:hypothetical protein